MQKACSERLAGCSEGSKLRNQFSTSCVEMVSVGKHCLTEGSKVSTALIFRGSKCLSASIYWR